MTTTLSVALAMVLVFIAILLILGDNATNKLAVAYSCGYTDGVRKVDVQHDEANEDFCKEAFDRARMLGFKGAPKQ